MEHKHDCGEHIHTESGPSCTLYNKIDRARVQCLNEYTEGTGVLVFKTWEERLNTTKVFTKFSSHRSLTRF